MSRLHLPFACGSKTLCGTLDTAPGTTGLLLVSGGNEIRSGAYSGQAHLAAEIARAGFPVFRFDRRGIGDSEGENRGFRNSAKDIASALEAFRAIAPQINRVFALGNCDAASALMLSEGKGLDGLILSNPWTIEESEESAEPQQGSDAIRSRYADKLRDPAELKRLLTGGVNFGKLARGLLRSLGPAPKETGLAQEIRAGLDKFQGATTILLADQDRTAQEFLRHWDSADERIQHCEGASHSYVEPHAREWLKARILEALRAH